LSKEIFPDTIQRLQYDFKRTLDLLPGIWCVLDSKSKIIYHNSSYSNLLSKVNDVDPLENYSYIGKTQEEAINHKSAFKDHLSISDKMVLESKKTISILCCVQKNNLKWLILQVDKRPVLNFDGEVEAIILHITDQSANRPLDLALAIAKESDPVKAPAPTESVLIDINNIQKSVELTQKESECLFYLTRGFSYKEIARKQGVTYRTIIDQIHRLKTKFNASTTSDLITKSLASGHTDSIPTNLFHKPIVIIL